MHINTSAFSYHIDRYVRCYNKPLLTARWWWGGCACLLNTQAMPEHIFYLILFVYFSNEITIHAICVGRHSFSIPSVLSTFAPTLTRSIPKRWDMASLRGVALVFLNTTATHIKKPSYHPMQKACNYFQPLLEWIN